MKRQNTKEKKLIKGLELQKSTQGYQDNQQFQAIKNKLEESLMEFNGYILRCGENADKEYSRMLLDRYFNALDTMQSYQAKLTNAFSQQQKPLQLEEQQERGISLEVMEIDDDNESLSDKNIITSFQHQYQKYCCSEKLDWNPYWKMNKKEKLAYLDKINKKYKRNIKKQRKCSPKKDPRFVRFSDIILYKCFKKNDEPVSLTKQPQRQQILIRQFWEYDEQ